MAEIIRGEEGVPIIMGQLPPNRIISGELWGLWIKRYDTGRPDLSIDVSFTIRLTQEELSAMGGIAWLKTGGAPTKFYIRQDEKK